MHNGVLEVNYYSSSRDSEKSSIQFSNSKFDLNLGCFLIFFIDILVRLQTSIQCTLSTKNNNLLQPIVIHLSFCLDVCPYVLIRTAKRGIHPLCARFLYFYYISPLCGGAFFPSKQPAKISSSLIRQVRSLIVGLDQSCPIRRIQIKALWKHLHTLTLDKNCLSTDEYS